MWAQSRAFAPWQPIAAAPIRDYDIRWGSWFFDAEATLRIEYNDNITSTEFDQRSDILITPGISVGGSWAWSDLNTLRLGMGARYRYYLRNGDLSSGGSSSLIDITPETEIDVLIFVGEAVIRVFDSLSYVTDATDQIARDPETGELSFDSLSYGLFVNTLGAQLSYDFNVVQTTAQLFRRDSISIEDAFNYAESVTYHLSGTVSRRVIPSLLVGVGASAVTTEYSDELKDDLTSYSIGVYGNYQLTPFVSLYAGINYGLNELSDADLDSVRSSQFVSYNISLSHTLNAKFDHAIGYTVETTPGGLADLLEVSEWVYRWEWVDFWPFDLNGSFSWTHRDESGGELPEVADIFGASVSANRQVGTRSEIAVGYRYTDKESDRLFRSYTRNVFWAEFSYDF